MATEQHPHGNRRPHFHRGRRGPDRRGDRRPHSAQPAQEPAKAEGVDVDQLVRDIKARIAQRHGIDLSASQIQELAARRLEAILDPRGIKPSLLEQLRKSAGAPANIAPAETSPGFEFEDHSIYDTHNGLLRGIRKLLNPLLKLFFNPNPIAHALNTQAKLNKEAARREQERERTQAEWNALQYTLVERLVTELARTSIEGQSLAMKVEALATRVDFYERRVREMENTAQPAQAAQPIAVPPRERESVRPQGGGPPSRPQQGPSSDGVAADGGGDGSRRRRRRRRGRRGPGGSEVIGAAAVGGGLQEAADDDSLDDGLPGDGESEEAIEAIEPPEASASAQAWTPAPAADPVPYDAPVVAAPPVSEPSVPAAPSPEPAAAPITVTDQTGPPTPDAS